jgi:protein SCO1/2
MTPQSKGLAAGLAGIAALLGVVAALLWHQRTHPQIELATGTYLSPQRTLPDFSLIDQHGQVFNPLSLAGHWSFMFFGYTNCPDLCPTTLTTLAAMEKKMRTAGEALRPRVVFVSVDARRDTPEQLAKYVPYFDPEFIGVTAPDQKTVEDVARTLGVAVAIKPNADGSGGYTVDHSAEIFVMDPQGKLSAVLTGPFTADGLRADFERIVAIHG